MIHPPAYIKELLKKHMECTASPRETGLLLAALDLCNEDEITQLLEEVDPGPGTGLVENKSIVVPPFAELQERIRQARLRNTWHSIQNFLSKVAAYIFLAVFAGGFFWLASRHSSLEYSCGRMASAGEVPPGPNKCRITLSNGCTILIDSSYQGPVIKQGNTEIIKSASGDLIYKRTSPATGSDTTRLMYNTIATSRGAQCRVVLPDGSIVRLNAASSIRFPVQFADTARVVEMEGEAYFDVAPMPATPFYARIRNAEIKVLGTGFNVNTYSNNTMTTLVNGSLEIKSSNDSLLLQPGQQAIIHPAKANNIDTMIRVSRADTAQITSWKKVMRIYDRISWKELVLDIGRRHDLEMGNLACVPDGYFSGGFCYDMPVEEILEVLRKKGLRFRKEGRKIIFCSAGVGR